MCRADFSTAHEQAILGGVLFDGAPAFNRITDILIADDFYHRCHQYIFQAIADLAEKGNELDAVEVAEALEQRDQLHDCGGIEYLVKLPVETASTSSIERFAAHVSELARVRRVRAVAARLAAGDMDALATLMAVAA